MPVQLSHPGVYIEEIPSGVRPITGVATSIAAFVGWAPKGPTDEAGHVYSWADYDRMYGGLDLGSAMSYAVSHFFTNGGQEAYIVRLVSEDAAPATLVEGGLTFTASGEGTWAEQYGISATPLTSDATRFGISVFRGVELQDRQVLEVFPNLSLDEDDPRFAESVINELSSIVNVEVDPLGGVPDTDASFLDNGDDGDVLAPDTAEFWSAATPDPPDDGGPRGGIYMLDRVDLFNLLCVPGLIDLGNLEELAGFCKARRAFLIADASSDIVNVDDVDPISGSDGTNAAIYYPWIRVSDPKRENRLRSFPPSGAVAGIYARTDATRGVWKAPAGIEASLTATRALTRTLVDAESGTLNKKGVNALRTFPVYGSVVWGARTCRGNDELGDEWKYIPVRRTALFIEETLFRSLKWVVFEPNDEPLWAQIRLNVGAFMHDQFRKGAFQGSNPREAYFVKCDRTTTTQNDINLGIVNILVGFAPLKPAEFVVVKLQQMAGQIQV